MTSPDEPDESVNNRAKAQAHHDQAIAALAHRQHGVVATWQLRRLGLAKRAIQYRATVGRLHRIYHGVYAVGHRTLTRRGRWMAAVLTYGREAVLSHRTAGALWGIATGGWKIDVTTPHGKRSRGGIRHHEARLHPEDVSRCDGIAVTSVARTILDLAAILDHDALTRVIENADRAGLLKLGALERAIARRPRCRGVTRLRSILADYRGAPDLRSKNERFFRKLIAKAGLPEPQWNVLVSGILVDACWPQWKLIVEIDSRAFHASPSAFERDRVRDAELQKLGYRVLRVTEKRLYADPQGVLRDIRVLAFRRAG
jgi:very-short-patch-repair endonuclease